MRLRNSLIFSAIAIASGCAAERPAPPDPTPSGPSPDHDVTPPGTPTRSLDLGKTVEADVAPPPLSGGTLTVARVGASEVAIASDPDRDRVYVVDMAARALTYDVALPIGAEPGRAVVDDAGRAHVVLRGLGSIATIDLTTGQLATQRAVCPAPRGLVFDAGTGLLHVACLGGELVSMPPVGDVVRTLQLPRDLRDVVVDDHRLLVSRFRSAEILSVDEKGDVVQTFSLPSVLAAAPQGEDAVYQPNVAWRMIALPHGGVAVVHQRAMTQDVSLQSTTAGVTPYGGGGCNPSVLHAAVSELHAGRVATVPPLARASLPVDIAVSPFGDQYAVVTAGNVAGANGTTQVRVLPTLSGRTVPVEFEMDTCRSMPGAETFAAGWHGHATSVAFAGNGALVVQSREPATLTIDGQEIVLSTVSRHDTGVTLFHLDSGAGMACASCHPEAGDDGRTWTFDGTGKRRTPSLRGGLLGTEPFHWSGDLVDFHAVVKETFVRRMGGATPTAEQSHALASWVNRVPTPALSPPADVVAVSRGQSIFESAETGCTSCHSGAQLTNNASMDVGKGMVQVPSLRGLQHRAPYMHDGCATTLRDRFGYCGGSAHGNTEQLSPSQIDDLVSFLDTL